MKQPNVRRGVWRGFVFYAEPDTLVNLAALSARSEPKSRDDSHQHQRARMRSCVKFVVATSNHPPPQKKRQLRRPLHNQVLPISPLREVTQGKALLGGGLDLPRTTTTTIVLSQV